MQLTPEQMAEISARDGFLTPITIEGPGILWMAIHGCVCLALRHPDYVGASRVLVVSFIKELGERLVANGALTREELALVEHVEREKSPHGGL